MAYYLQWSGSTGDQLTNDEVLEISGIAGSLVSVQYTVKAAAPASIPGAGRYVFDIRRSVGSTADGGGVGYIFQSGTTTGTNGTSGFTKNGVTFSDGTLFFRDYVSDDVFKFNVNQTPSGGCIAIGCRFSEIQHNYGFAVSEIIITDANGAHTINMSDSGGTGTSLTSTDSAITATLYNFPVDGSQWVSYFESVPSVPPNVSGSIVSGSADLSWGSVSNAQTYTYEFRRRI